MDHNPLLYAAKPEATRLLLVRPLIEFDFYFFPIFVDQTRKNIQNEENRKFPFLLRIVDYIINKMPTLQMFTGVYRVFIGKSEYRDFKFIGIACYPQSL
jgi:hypothetical protein